jgi:hypothetical protein
MTNWEVKYFAKDNWEQISEIAVLGYLVDSFDCLSPIIVEMLQGKEIAIADRVFRMKNCGNKCNHFIKE